jgi:tRNA-splicing ligase RtcB
MADHHLGYSMPIGGVVAYENAISPSGVGFDIACGNKAVRTDVLASDVPVPAVMREIQRIVSFGLGRRNPDPVDHPLFDSPVWDELDTAPGQPLKEKARAQLGTVGSGNHYVDLLVDGEGYLWIANHFGSRGFGHTVATWFLAVAAGGSLGERVKESEQPSVLDIGTPGGDLYVESMRLAGQYAYAGRDYVIEQVLGILGDPAVSLSVHNHHNFAWEEDGLWVVRKGATPLTREPAFIGGSMGDVSVIVRGRNAATIDEFVKHGADVFDIGALRSAPHGAGRTMSRTKAAGTWKKVPVERTAPDGTKYQKRIRVRDASTAAIDFDSVKADLAARGITVLGSGADEAPAVYKDLLEVIGHHKNIEVLHTLDPLGVVMAGDDTPDPYKD